MKTYTDRKKSINQWRFRGLNGWMSSSRGQTKIEGPSTNQQFSAFYSKEMYCVDIYGGDCDAS